MERGDPNPNLCTRGCGFFGSASTSKLCSKCYRDSILKQNVSILEAEEESKAEDPSTSGDNQNNSNKKVSNRCFVCKKKVGLMGFSCKCGGIYCSLHRYSDKHGCEFDYQREGKDKIEKANPIVKAEKIEKI